MDVERVLESYLETTAEEVALDPIMPAVVIQRIRRRRRVIGSATALLLTAVLIATGSTVQSLVRSSEHRLVGAPSGGVPDVIGQSEFAGVKLLGRHGLMGDIRYDPQSSPVGVIVRQDPQPGASRPTSKLISLVIAGRGEINGPPGGVKNEPDEALAPFNAYIGANPQAFVGVYRTITGEPVVVFNPSVDPRAWKPRLNALSHGRAYLTENCTHSLSQLERVQEEVVQRGWSPQARSIDFAVAIDVATCTVRLTSKPLRNSVLEALSTRFGPLITVDESGSVERLAFPSRQTKGGPPSF